MSRSAGSTLTNATAPGSALEESPFHSGERALQERAGRRERMEQIGRKVIRGAMPDQHREFFAELPSLIVGSLDASGRVWASMLFGTPGFVVSPDPHRLEIAARPVPGDPLGSNLSEGAPIGLFGLQFETRRRNRMNGTLTTLRPDGFSVSVGQSFGNCAKYIQTREPIFVFDPLDVVDAPVIEKEGTLLSEKAARLVGSADTFFIATASPNAGTGPNPADGVDVSHRGGNPGFVHIAEKEGRTILLVPDFLGNFFFNTYGNLMTHPSAGLLFIDFIDGHLLWLTGHGEVAWEAEGFSYPGAERYFRFSVQEGYWSAAGAPLRWTAPNFESHLAATGPWLDR